MIKMVSIGILLVSTMLWGDTLKPMIMIDRFNLKTTEKLFNKRIIGRLNNCAMVKLNSNVQDIFIGKNVPTIYLTDSLYDRILYNYGFQSINSFNNSPDQFVKLASICADSAGKIYVLDDYEQKLIKLTNFKGVVSKQWEKKNLYKNVKGGLLYKNSSSNIFLLDKDEKIIKKINSNGDTISSLSFVNSIPFIINDFACDPNGNFILCSDNGIFKYSSSGVMVASKMGTNCKNQSLDIDKWGNVYVIHSDNYKLIKFDSNLKLIFVYDFYDDLNFSSEDNDYSGFPRDIGINNDFGMVLVVSEYGGILLKNLPGINITQTSNIAFSPYNAFTKCSIKYKVSAESLIDIFISDKNGSLIRNIVSRDWQTIQEHSFMWDGKNNSGKYLPDGDYFCNIIGLTAQIKPQQSDFDNNVFNSTIYNKYFGDSFGQEIKQTITVTPSLILVFLNSQPNSLTSLKTNTTLQYIVSQNCLTTISIYKSKYENGTFKPDTKITSIAINKQDLTGNELYTHWNGRDSAGNDVLDGVYFWAGKIKNSDSESDLQYFQIGVDRKPIKITLFKSSYAFAPKSSNSEKNKMKINFKLNEPGFVTIKIKNKAGVYIKTLANNQYFDSSDSEYILFWDGKDTKGYIIQEGEYHVEIKVLDVTGNSFDINK